LFLLIINETFVQESTGYSVWTLQLRSDRKKPQLKQPSKKGGVANSPIWCCVPHRDAKGEIYNKAMAIN